MNSKHPRDKIRRNLEDDLLELTEFLRRPLTKGAAPGFCQALQLDVNAKVLEPTWTDQGKRWSDFPWVTLVLGSGPVGLPDVFWEVVELLPRLVNNTIRESVFEGDPLVNRVGETGIIVQDFLRSLTRDRVGDPPDRDQDAEPRKIGEFVAGLVLVAARLTRVFHLVSLLSSRPVSRWGTVVAQTRTHDGRSNGPGEDALASLRDEVETLQAALDFARHRLRTAPPAWTPGGEFLTAVGQLLKAIDDNFAFRRFYRVNLDHLREITDVAWQCLVWEVCGNSYPGWTELMLDLVLLQQRDEATVERRPRWRELQELSRQIKGIVQPAAERSWERRWAPPKGVAAEGGRADATRDFYHAAATLLWKQSQVARSERESATEAAGGQAPLRMTAASLPNAVAFVTSFDLELEMALLRTRPEGMRKLSVVVPVYLVNGRAAEGEFLWLEGVIDLTKAGADGERALECLTDPDEWRVMYQGRLDLPEHPIVVRLTGSPLVKLPSLPRLADPTSGSDDDEGTLASDLRDVGAVQKEDSLFVHSATVDEYLALRQAEAEYFWVYSRNSFANSSSRALPKSLLACREPGPIRFWMAVGVPVKDPAVRLRVLSQMGNRRFMLDGRADIPDAVETDPGAAAGGGHREIPGVAVNWKLDDEESMLLTSLGLRVIKQGRAEDFATYLAHHAWHLGAFAAGQEDRAGLEECPKEPVAKGNVQ